MLHETLQALHLRPFRPFTSDSYTPKRTSSFYFNLNYYKKEKSYKTLLLLDTCFMFVSLEKCRHICPSAAGKCASAGLCWAHARRQGPQKKQHMYTYILAPPHSIACASC